LRQFIDLFAGSGLSLGFMLAGWNGLFVVEHDSLHSAR
jgi:site-specific DNA-cytosine methylase